MLDLEMTFAETGNQSTGIAPYTVAAPATLGSYVAQRKMTLFVTGGTVTLLRFSRAGVFLNLPFIAGSLELDIGDSVELTYAVAPTLTVIPR